MITVYKKVLIITLAAIGLSFLASSCVKEKGFEDRVQDIAQTKKLSGRIATLNEQAAGMEKSITQLLSAKEKLEQYAAKLKQGLEAAKSEISSNKDKIATLETELAKVNKSIGKINESIETIKAGLLELRQHVDDTIGDTRKWVEQTYATLEYTKKADSLLAMSIDSNKRALDTVYTHCRKEISDSLGSAVKGIQTWVNGQLTGYWTIAQTEAKLDSVARAVEVKDSAALSDSLKKASADLTTAYKAAIKHSIDSLGGALNDTINDRITNATNALEAKITTINTRLAALEATVKNLVARIQSVEVIPEYQDGSVGIKQSGAVTISFEVRPASLLDSLVKSSATKFSLLAVETKAVTKAVTYDTLVVKDAKVDSPSILTLTVSNGNLPDEFFAGTKPFNARLRISDGNNDKSSAYFPLYAKVVTDLSKNGTSNCYIVSKAGDYKFKATVKGNCADSVIAPTAVSVLWESFGTSTAPTVGDLVSDVTLSSDGYVNFTASDKKGNAVIAARDASLKILWSWHIWLTDQPSEQDYNNSAGRMLDRNLGATSATKGEVSALGLLYQWGRKDPFLGADAIFYDSGTTPKKAASTMKKEPTPRGASMCLEGGDNTLAYSISHPTTYITNQTDPYDWYCINLAYHNDNLWVTPSGKKTIYDPCPVGYRVPNGGKSTDYGVWAKAFNSDDPITESTGFDYGFDFGATTNKLVSSGTCWYPAAGYYNYSYSLDYIGANGLYWSCTASGNSNAYDFNFTSSDVIPLAEQERASGRSVRCVKETNY